MAANFKTAAKSLARAAWDKKGESVSLLDVSRTSPITDYLVIATALSRPHLHALEEAVEKEADALGLECLRKNRPQSDHWRILDFGNVIVHLMTPEARSFYSLEKLNGQAKLLSWEPSKNGQKKPSAKKPRAAAARS